VFVDAQSGARTAESRPPRSQQRNKLQHRPHSKPRLTQVIPASGLSIPKSLPNDVLKVRVHTAKRASPAGASLAARQDGWPAAIVSGTSINWPVFTS